RLSSDLQRPVLCVEVYQFGQSTHPMQNKCIFAPQASSTHTRPTLLISSPSTNKTLINLAALLYVPQSHCTHRTSTVYQMLHKSSRIWHGHFLTYFVILFYFYALSYWQSVAIGDHVATSHAIC